ncbi:FAD-binding domain-containing protein [Fomitopsis serialis]|uniref:FAD-binding domain-containing protein n=1 Tax=Fomitopsis serialis TaxID=139415 RepID=UPI002007F6B1|nr:FAD-binding domain-containing protein [Neoantrodia serialis]KAH9937580.1 FAD-binding domain-containing protein [Neoantrodia serialis]
MPGSAPSCIHLLAAATTLPVVAQHVPLVPPRPPPRVAARPRRCTRSLSQLNSVTEADLAHFSQILPPTAILSTLSSTPAADLEPFNNDWMNKYHGRSTTVLRPHTTQQVSAIVKHCNERRIGIVPQGGNTGLVGGGVPVKDELVLSLGNMSSVRGFDDASGILVADAGCILQSLSDFLLPHDHIVPLDLGAKGSCQIGGNVSTNAGGLRLLRYGSLHGSVLGLEVVLPDGTILDQLTSLRKDNTGYDLKQLFIGAEGTLGVVTGVSILTAAAPQASNNMMLALPAFSNVLPLYKEVKRQLAEILSAFEFIDRRAYDLAVKHGQGRALDEADVEGADCFVLVETSGSNREHDEQDTAAQKLNKLLEDLMEQEPSLINTGVLATSPAQFSSLWAIREGLTEAVGKEGKAYKYDISVPQVKFKEVLDITRDHLASKGLMHDEAVKHVVGYGHVGDGNLHLNVVANAYTPEIEAALEPFVYELVAKYQGSISAEHGIGVMKTHALPYSKNAVSIEWMKRVKNLFDPNGIMNPGKVLEL